MISDGTAVSYTANVLDVGAVDVIKRSADGLTSLGAGETISDSDEIAFVQGTAAGNIISTWIPGSKISGWSGYSYVDQTPQVTKLAFATDFTAAGVATVKFVEHNGGQQAYNRKSYILNVAAGLSSINFCLALEAAINANPPSWIVTPVTNNGTNIDITGTTFADSTSPKTELASFKTASEGIDGGNGMVITVSTSGIGPSLGHGDPEVMADYEKTLEGNKSFYNRVTQPNTPPRHIVLTDTYDVYTLTYDNPEPGQIRGVDNKRSISIAYKVSGAGQTAMEGQLNPYLASCPGAFGGITL
jgi:hypothetical protein